MTELQVRQLFDKHNLKWSDFMEWMIGQTISADENGNTIYYEGDVRRFVRMKTTGKESANWD